MLSFLKRFTKSYSKREESQDANEPSIQDFDERVTQLLSALDDIGNRYSMSKQWSTLNLSAAIREKTVQLKSQLSSDVSFEEMSITLTDIMLAIDESRRRLYSGVDIQIPMETEKVLSDNNTIFRETKYKRFEKIGNRLTSRSSVTLQPPTRSEFEC
jgi:hypothetical protein